MVKLKTRTVIASSGFSAAGINRSIPNFVLEFVPAYSPDYNIIELVWYLCKEYIAHSLFQSVDELKYLLDKPLNQDELVIKWHKKIKKKGNRDYVAIKMPTNLTY